MGYYVNEILNPNIQMSNIDAQQGCANHMSIYLSLYGIIIRNVAEIIVCCVILFSCLRLSRQMTDNINNNGLI